MFKFLSTVYIVCCSLFLIGVKKWKASIISREQRKTDVRFWQLSKLVHFHKNILKTADRSKLDGKAAFY